MEWRDIATAPKDETPVLLWLAEPISRRGVGWKKQAPCPQITIGLWGSTDPDYGRHDQWVPIETEDCGSMGGEMTGWMAHDERIPVEPTHWMPLPPAPEGK